jgi:wyosine [tRNA(Phe)-imidazoG37] synthetase (radical SAM superfamily)
MRSRLKEATVTQVAITGPNPHPLLGSTIGIDFSPKKVCSFDCIYCGVGMSTTRKTLTREMFYPVDDVIDAVDAFVELNGQPDAFFLTGSGEPTLYKGFGEVAERLRQRYPEVVRTLYTNGSMLWNPDVRREMLACDPIMGNLNCVDEAVFARMTRHSPEASLQSVISGYKTLKAELLDQQLWLDGVFLKDANDDPDGLRALGETLAVINPDVYIVRTTRRVIEDLCEPVDAGFQAVVEDTWAGFDFPIRFFLPPS